MERGRPTKYDESMNEQAYKLCLLGFTDQELADFFEVHEDTINEWKKVHENFSVSVNRGKAIADAEVAQSFHKRAVGYTFEEKTFEGGELTKTVEKEMAPDPGAALNWLKNRQPDKWRDKQSIDHTTKGESLNKPKDLSVLTDDELKAMAAIQRKINAE